MSHAKLTKTGPGLAKVYDKVKKQMHGEPRVVVGVLGSHAARSDGGEIDNVGLAVVMEFGAPSVGVPERSFLRSTFDRLKNDWYHLAVRMLRGVAAEKLELHDGLALMGERMKADVKKAITTGAGIPPPNAPATIRGKGSSRPLVDSGRLVGSIDYEVRKH